MTTRVIRTEEQRDDYFNLIRSRPLPQTVSTVKGGSRSIKQNKLQRLWINEAAEQLQDETAEEKRGYCKLVHGVPILRSENDQYREKYDKLIKPLPYEIKLGLMMEPASYQVTSVMTSKQKQSI